MISHPSRSWLAGGVGVAVEPSETSMARGRKTGCAGAATVWGQCADLRDDQQDSACIQREEQASGFSG